MNESSGDSLTSYLIIYLLMILSTSVTFHYKTNNYLRASVLAAATTTFLYLFYSYIETGYLDPFFWIAMIIGGLISLGIALLVGLPFWLYRRRQASQGTRTGGGNHFSPP